MTPLDKKLGIKESSEILVLNSPKKYTDFFVDFPNNVVLNEVAGKQEIGFIHVFVKTAQELEHYFSLAKKSLKKNGILWISWPKKTSKIETELDKFSIMKYGQDNGLVDTKVAAIDEDWSGHKFMYRLKDR
ncbi:hypothetical protein GGR42_002784 [Saonia flava]|uniref:DUF3052 domain-containing protein n=1 Tax=Saonia flava TaxID=523696 RepID=A0A846R1I8_9FLAO|nr:DUF3052 family protein [Saonia flava]NJB72293.1 hypothetical protein [Saonia flava]